MTNPSIRPEVAIGIFVICGIFLLVIIVLLIYLWCRRREGDDKGDETMYRGFKQRNAYELTCIPSPGIHYSPLVVTLHSSSNEPCDILIDVAHTPHHMLSDNVAGITASRGDTSTDSAAQLLSSNESHGEHFQLYRSPLQFTRPGTYTIKAHTVYPNLRILGAVHNFTFDVHANNQSTMNDAKVEQLQGQERLPDPSPQSPRFDLADRAAGVTERQGRLFPPRIVPEDGEVTTFTPIVISPSEDGAPPDQIRYSVDGTYPSILYTAPFTLSVPPFNANNPKSPGVSIVVRAVAICCRDKELASDVVEAHLTVHKPGHTFLDPAVPAPVVQVRAVDAMLYFDETKRPPNTCILYQLVYVAEARQKPKFSRKRGILYDGKSIPLSDDVAFVYAWTFSPEEGGATSPAMNDCPTGRRHKRSSAAVYDCRRGAKWNRGLREEKGDGVGQSDLDNSLSPPIICISCKESEVFFDDPPAGGIICYTLDCTEPRAPNAAMVALHMSSVGLPRPVRLEEEAGPASEVNSSTRIYRPGQPIYVTQLEVEQVYLTARTFIPIVDPVAGGSVTGYRFSERFFRGFSTQ
ncbi:hypothetical protein ERJ75_001237000 [Trypanosoma vivax]|uniref:Uncharacterized protein n=1 Tax=Trypanosoma vivax (strain Y486) TaxID=1055687 RepID=F9WSC8_TRYVY|nr:hypothetical protein TRVL_00003 [Trypanosoma vivax]KAH8609107.1 hypothetical protein ERJ75_001237000 [Trypanosoma vivax]CCD20467.1 hypothetical protein, conserved [Trypanosoma vivax Y486]|eukprot:CCD20467.1 hypothetical protein, conserved [Trypanosoma vivax Y486]